MDGTEEIEGDILTKKVVIIVVISLIAVIALGIASYRITLEANSIAAKYNDESRKKQERILTAVKYNTPVYFNNEKCQPLNYNYRDKLLTLKYGSGTLTVDAADISTD